MSQGQMVRLPSPQEFGGEDLAEKCPGMPDHTHLYIPLLQQFIPHAVRTVISSPAGRCSQFVEIRSRGLGQKARLVLRALCVIAAAAVAAVEIHGSPRKPRGGGGGGGRGERRLGVHSREHPSQPLPALPVVLGLRCVKQSHGLFQLNHHPVSKTTIKNAADIQPPSKIRRQRRDVTVPMRIILVEEAGDEHCRNSVRLVGLRLIMWLFTDVNGLGETDQNGCTAWF